MPYYSFRCSNCRKLDELFMPIARMIEVENSTFCDSCGHQMKHVVARPAGKWRPFPAFTVHHLAPVVQDGRHTHREERAITFSSLHDIRRYEKKNENRKLVWEPGSYDSKYGDL